VNQLLKTGDIVRLRRSETDEEWTQARVKIASSNGKSVLLELGDGVRTNTGGLYAGGMMPLSIEPENETVRDLITGTFYEVEVARSS
jgi:hypothetical protein